MSSMKMYLNWDTSVPFIFFHWWTASTPASFAASLVLVFLLAFLYELLISLRARLDMLFLISPESEKSKATNAAFTTGQQAVRAALYALSTFYSLSMMMIFMLFNGYLCTVMVLGAGVGFLFASAMIPSGAERPRTCCGC